MLKRDGYIKAAVAHLFKRAFALWHRAFGSAESPSIDFESIIFGLVGNPVAIAMMPTNCHCTISSVLPAFGGG